MPEPEPAPAPAPARKASAPAPAVVAAPVVSKSTALTVAPLEEAIELRLPLPVELPALAHEASTGSDIGDGRPKLKPCRCAGLHGIAPAVGASHRRDGLRDFVISCAAFGSSCASGR
jgi:hypothetical protein